MKPLTRHRLSGEVSMYRRQVSTVNKSISVQLPQHVDAYKKNRKITSCVDINSTVMSWADQKKVNGAVSVQHNYLNGQLNSTSLLVNVSWRLMQIAFSGQQLISRICRLIFSLLSEMRIILWHKLQYNLLLGNQHTVGNNNAAANFLNADEFQLT